MAPARNFACHGANVSVRNTFLHVVLSDEDEENDMSPPSRAQCRAKTAPSADLAQCWAGRNRGDVFVADEDGDTTELESTEGTESDDELGASTPAALVRCLTSDGFGDAAELGSAEESEEDDEPSTPAALTRCVTSDGFDGWAEADARRDASEVKLEDRSAQPASPADERVEPETLPVDSTPPAAAAGREQLAPSPAAMPTALTARWMLVAIGNLAMPTQGLTVASHVPLRFGGDAPAAPQFLTPMAASGVGAPLRADAPAIAINLRNAIGADQALEVAPVSVEGAAADVRACGATPPKSSAARSRRSSAWASRKGTASGRADAAVVAGGGSAAGPQAAAPCSETRTTVILRNLPNNYTRADLVSLIHASGFAGLYDFLYFPVDFRTRAALGYAFVNLVTPRDADSLLRKFDGFRQWRRPSSKVCTATWSSPHQGLECHVARYRNSPLMHPLVPDEYRPILLRNGVRVPFPPPSRKLKPPRQGAELMLV